VSTVKYGFDETDEYLVGNLTLEFLPRRGRLRIYRDSVRTHRSLRCSHRFDLIQNRLLCLLRSYCHGWSRTPRTGSSFISSPTKESLPTNLSERSDGGNILASKQRTNQECYDAGEEARKPADITFLVG